MKKYEAMFILKANMGEKETNEISGYIEERIVKNGGEVAQKKVWQQKRKLTYPIKKHNEGMYYMVNFSISGGKVNELKKSYKLNENILILLILNLGA